MVGLKPETNHSNRVILWLIATVQNEESKKKKICETGLVIIMLHSFFFSEEQPLLDNIQQLLNKKFVSNCIFFSFLAHEQIFSKKNLLLHLSDPE